MLSEALGRHSCIWHLQEKQAQLEEVNQKVDSLQMVEQWQSVQESYNRVIAWQNVGSPAASNVHDKLVADVCSKHQWHRLTPLQTTFCKMCAHSSESRPNTHDVFCR